MYYNLLFFLFAMQMALVVGGIGAYLDIRQIKKGKKITLAKKWIWNIVEMIILCGLITLKGVEHGFSWFLIGMLYAISWFLWRIVHDGFIGLGLVNDFFYVGKGAWDAKMLATYQGNKYLYFTMNKCLPLGILLAGFLTN